MRSNQPRAQRTGARRKQLSASDLRRGRRRAQRRLTQASMHLRREPRSFVRRSWSVPLQLRWSRRSPPRARPTSSSRSWLSSCAAWPGSRGCWPSPRRAWRGGGSVCPCAYKLRRPTSPASRVLFAGTALIWQLAFIVAAAIVFHAALFFGLILALREGRGMSLFGRQAPDRPFRGQVSDHRRSDRDRTRPDAAEIEASRTHTPAQ